MPMNPRLLRPIAARAGFNFNPLNLTLVFDTSKEPANLTVSVPLNGTVNCTISWGDGTSETHTTTGFKTKTYAAAGVYVVQISGTMTVLSFGPGASSTSNKLKLVRCLSFGNVGLTSLFDGFRNCQNLIQCPASLPTTSNVTSLGICFFGCTSFNDARIAGWNTGSVTDMSFGFSGCTAFNQNIGSWNTAAVTNMNAMFNACPAFNQNIGSWNTAAVTNMASMFNGCTAFNQNIGSWNTAAVTNMTSVFSACTAFNQNIGSWNTAAVTAMPSMFQDAAAFNQNIGGWNTAAVTNMTSMFLRASAFNQNIGSWNTANVNTMQFMLNGANAFSQDISGWDIRKVTTMSLMFSGSTWGTANYDAALEDWADLADTDLKSQAITAFAVQGANTRVTSNGHGMVAGSRVNISGTTSYNGDFNIIAAAANTFDIGVTFVANDATGTMKHRRSRAVAAGFGSNKYSAGTPTTKRGDLTTTYNWTITDGGQV